MIKTRNRPSRSRQKGMTLLIILMLLLISGVMAITGATIGRVDEKIAQNARDASIAHQAAEAALRDARADLLGSRVFYGATGASYTCDSTGYKGFCLATTTSETSQATLLANLLDTSKSVAFGEMTGRSASEQFGSSSVPGGVTRQPRYVIEPILDDESVDITSGTPHYVYRITALGFGALSGTQIMIQEVVRISD